MACFLVPAAEAAAVSLVERREAKASANEPSEVSMTSPIPWGQKLSWLSTMLWGGSLLLLLEHLWHGEVVPWPPFLTAAADPAGMATMIQEMATTGVSMAVLVTLVWGVGVAVIDRVPALTRRAALSRGAR